MSLLQLSRFRFGSVDGDRTDLGRSIVVITAAIMLMMAFFSLTAGAADASLVNAFAAWTGLFDSNPATAQRDLLILRDIRLPRVITGIVVGASLAVSGAVMQGLFRNPLADPGVVGVSSGAGLGAITIVVLGKTWFPAFLASAGVFALPFAAFLGALAVTALLYRLATHNGITAITTLVLAGIAVGAVAFSLTGLLIFVADEQQLRELTFWQLGSLAGSTWIKLLVAAPLMVVSVLVMARLSRGLNAIMMGEGVALHLGIEVQRLKHVAIVCVSAATGAAVAVSGGIAFVGIVVPHILRLAIGPDYRALIPASAFAGATLLLGADVFARTIVAPAELPIGIITAIIGAPVFIAMLMRRSSIEGL
jgi:iron complex transport system permease protein